MREPSKKGNERWSFETRLSSLEARNAAEEDFFSQGIWRDLSRENLGIDTLRKRLSDILFDLIQSELPNLIGDLKQKISECDDALQKLGQSRPTAEDQRQFLSKIAEDFQRICTAAIKGSYEDHFFGDIEDRANYPKRLHTVVQNRNKKFREQMHLRGHYREIIDTESIVNQELDKGGPIKISRKEYIKEVIDILDQTQGRELPGMFDPMIVSRLFSKQASPWRIIADEHIESVWQSVLDFLSLVLSQITDMAISSSLLENFVGPAMETRLQSMQKKLAELIKPYQVIHPITYNHYFLDTVQKIQHERVVANLKARIMAHLNIGSETDFQSSNYRTFNPKRLIDTWIDYMEAYYKVALKTFIDNTAVENIELILIEGLEQLLSLTAMYLIDEHVVRHIAAEPTQLQNVREQTQKKREALQLGLDICKSHAAFIMPGATYRSRRRISSHPDAENNKKTDADDSISQQGSTGDYTPIKSTNGSLSPPMLEEELPASPSAINGVVEDGFGWPTAAPVPPALETVSRLFGTITESPKETKRSKK
ncbi:MAG: hypothetical protein M1814_002325 [Vezdaea aestivalis]|nr:MAG: hypothetical protein M1814_002325 [Vezdaea aestivalis]